MTELVKGLNQTLRNFKTMPQAVRQAYIAACRLQAGRIMTESLEQVPVEFNTLRDSHYGAEDSANVFIGSNGVAILMGYRAEYAWMVHEISPTTGGRWGTGNKHKPPTKWKYLEDPLKKAHGTFNKDVSAIVAQALAGSVR